MLLRERGEGCYCIHLIHSSTTIEIIGGRQAGIGSGGRNQPRNNAPRAFERSRTGHRHVGKARPHVVVPAAMVPHLIPPWRLSASEAGLMASSFWPAARSQSLDRKSTRLNSSHLG